MDVFPALYAESAFTHLEFVARQNLYDFQSETMSAQAQVRAHPARHVITSKGAHIAQQRAAHVNIPQAP